jgi:hypothetical protein
MAKPNKRPKPRRSTVLAIGSKTQAKHGAFTQGPYPDIALALAEIGAEGDYIFRLGAEDEPFKALYRWSDTRQEWIRLHSNDHKPAPKLANVSASVIFVYQCSGHSVMEALDLKDLESIQIETSKDAQHVRLRHTVHCRVCGQSHQLTVTDALTGE